MKILLPYKKLNGVSIHSDDVSGGIEIFCKRLLDIGHDVIVVEYDITDSRKRLVKPMIMEAIELHKPDLIISNFATKTYTTNLADVGVPIMWIFHSLGDTVHMITHAQDFEEFRAKGHSVYMVSDYQLSTWKGMAKRNKISDDLEIDGIIDSAFNVFDDLPLDKEIDCCTISRPTKGKDAYLMNKRFLKDGVDLNYTLVTSDPLREPDIEYVQSATKNGLALNVKKNITRSETIDTLRKSSVYIATSYRETWGITTLEALSYGIPVLSLSDAKGSGPISSIAPNKDCYDTFTKKDSTADILAKINKLASKTAEERKEIMDLTREKHSKARWLSRFNEMIENSLKKYKGIS